MDIILTAEDRARMAQRRDVTQQISRCLTPACDGAMFAVWSDGYHLIAREPCLMCGSTAAFVVTYPTDNPT